LEGSTLSNGNSSLLDTAKFFREHIQTILSLATGSFVLSVTFLHDIAPKAQHVEYLKRSWGIFVATIVLGLIYNYVLSIYVTNDGKRYGTVLNVVSFFFHGCFVAAIYFLLRFGTANL
jgi:membrane-bound acyltransferase YfiQ involved in biofilm formation